MQYDCLWRWEKKFNEQIVNEYFEGWHIKHRHILAMNVAQTLCENVKFCKKTYGIVCCTTCPVRTFFF